MNHSAISIIGRGYATPSEIFPELTQGEGNPREYLKNPRTKKFMGPQDLLSVVALGRAFKGLEYDGRKVGLYMAVGFVPFDEKALLNLARLSSGDQGDFSMEAFSNQALKQFNPLLTFRCLPNMPAYHCSANFGIQGASYIAYPGVGQFYLALERAMEDLQEDRVEMALVGGCADQENFLVSHRLKITLPAGISAQNSAAFIVLEKTERAIEKGRSIAYSLEEFSLRYDGASDLWDEFFGDQKIPFYLGPASVPLFLNTDEPSLKHCGRSLDGYTFESLWKKP